MYVFDEEKNPPCQVHEQCEDYQREKPVDIFPLVEAGISQSAPVQKHLIQNHVQKDADIAEHFGARVAQELVFRSSLRRGEVAEDENRLEEVVDESEAEEQTAARATQFRVGEEF